MYGDAPINPCDSRLRSAGKPPKLRFKPGTILRLAQADAIPGLPKGGWWQVAYVYRLITAPSEWIYVLAHLTTLTSGGYADRVEYTPFISGARASSFFYGVHVGRDSQRLKSVDLMRQKPEVVSSGDILPPDGTKPERGVVKA